MRWVGWGLVGLALGLALAWFSVLSLVAVDAVRVDRGTVVEEPFGRGTIESEREAELGFELVGRLTHVLVDEGDRVTLGQELARIDTDVAQAELQSARTGIAAARATLKRLAADEQRARTLLATAEREAARPRKLLESGIVASRESDEAEDRLRVARAELDHVLGQRTEATRGIDVASSAAEQRRVAVVRATLLAPFDSSRSTVLARSMGDSATRSVAAW